MADIRGRAILVPSHAAAEQLRRTIEDHRLAAGSGAVVLPSLLTRDDWRAALHADLPRPLAAVDGFEREVLLQAAARAAIADGCPPPFTIRPGLITEMLGFYDGVRRHGRTVEDFERVAVDGARERRRHRSRGRPHARADAVPRGRVPPVRGAARGPGPARRARSDRRRAGGALLPLHPRDRRRRRSRGRRVGSLAVGLRPADAHRRALDASTSSPPMPCSARGCWSGCAAGFRSTTRSPPSPSTRRRRPCSSRRPRATPCSGGRAIARRNWRRSCATSSGTTGGSRTCRSRARRWSSSARSRTSTWPGRSSRRPACRSRRSTRCPSPRNRMRRPSTWSSTRSIRASPGPRSSASSARRCSSYRAAGRPITSSALAQLDRRLSEARYLADPAELGRFAREWSSPGELQRAARAAAAVGGRAGIALGRRAAHGAPWHGHPLPRRARASAARAVARRGAPPQSAVRRAHGLDAASRSARPLRRCAAPLRRDGGLRPPLDRAADLRSAPGHGRRPVARRRRRPLRRVRHDAPGRAHAAGMARERRAEHLLSGLHAPGPSLARGCRRADG